MALTSDKFALEPDQLAIVFNSDAGVSALELGVFLQRASTVARRVGADLYVVALDEGSLAVVSRVVRRGAKAAADEFKSSPIRTTGAVVSSVAAAIALAIVPRPGNVSPLARSGAELIEHSNVTEINLVTINQTYQLMDERRAAEVRMYGAGRAERSALTSEIRGLVQSAEQGDLSGTVLLVDGELHFRPDGFRYLVPIVSPLDVLPDSVQPGRHLIVWGDLRLRNSLPDTLAIRDARSG